MWEIIPAGSLSRFYGPVPIAYSKASFSGAKTKPVMTVNQIRKLTSDLKDQVTAAGINHD
jgi:hypothetical protein